MQRGKKFKLLTCAVFQKFKQTLKSLTNEHLTSTQKLNYTVHSKQFSQFRAYRL